MNILSLLAQASDYSYTTSSSGSEAVAFGILVFIFMFGLIFSAAAYFLTAVCLLKIFRKANTDNQWAAWVPFYNFWKLLELGGQKGYWSILSLVPIVNIAAAVFMFIAQYHVGKKLGKGGEFVLWAIFFPYVWFIWLAFDRSTWNESEQAPQTVSL
jgi:hypothetical protein